MVTVRCSDCSGLGSFTSISGFYSETPVQVTARCSTCDGAGLVVAHNGTCLECGGRRELVDYASWPLVTTGPCAAC